MSRHVLGGDPAVTGGAAEPREVEVTERHRVWDGFLKVEVLELRHRRYAGDWTPPLRRELLCQRNAVAVLPYDPMRDEVLLIEQFRTGALDRAARPWLIDIPAGICEPGEVAIDVARRELAEEAGIEARRIIPFTAFWTSPGVSSEHIEMFVAEVDLCHGERVHGLEDEGEDILSHVLGAEEAFAWLDQGRITGVIGVVALLWLQGRRPWLQAHWATGRTDPAAGVT